MFIMLSCCHKQVPPQAVQCLGGQFACTTMHYVMFLTIVDVTNGDGGGVVLATRTGFIYELILGYCRVRYFQPHR